MNDLQRPTGLSLPSTEYKITFRDGSISLLDVHPDQTLDGSLEEMLRAAGSADEEVASVELIRAFVLDEEFGTTN
ncbi:MAG: hypothetical protein SangKO_099250 [Sandaracinaceae bacterium]